MTWPFENDTHKVEKKLATQSLSANKTTKFPRRDYHVYCLSIVSIFDYLTL